MATIPSIAMIPSGYKANKVYSVLPTDGSGDLTFARASTATRINKDGLIEEVAIGVPRLDYEGGGCPSLLLEPASTNLLPYSEDFSFWDANGAVITANQAISPSGVLNASLISAPSSGNRFADVISSVGGTYTFSFYIKAKEGESGVWSSRVIGDSTIAHNTEVNDSSWTRITQTFTLTGSGSLIVYPAYNISGTSTLFNAYIWGCQLEQKSYATSYIKTSGSQITRLAETANGAGDSSTFNDSEGVLFFEASTLLNGGTYMTISINDGTSSNHISLLYRIQENEVWMQTSGSGSDTNINIYDVVQNINNKIALSYSSNGIKIFVNGILKGSSSINALPIGLDSVEFNNGAQGEKFYGNTKDLRVYNTALTDLEIETLVSYTSFNAMALNFNYKIQ